MKTLYDSRPLRVALFALLAVVPLHASPSGNSYGALGALKAQKEKQSLSIQDMLKFSIEDEYLAHAEYEAIMAKYGAIKPYQNIRASEADHIEWLKGLYRARKLDVPLPDTKGLLVLPKDLKEAAQIGVDAEISNIAMYDYFLSLPVFKLEEISDVKAVFIRLRDASKNHLNAFKTQLGKY